MDNDHTEHENWGDLRAKYRKFREDMDGAYLLAIVEWHALERVEMSDTLKRLGLRIVDATKEGRQPEALVSLQEYIEIASSAHSPTIERFAEKYWDWEGVAFDYQHALRERIYHDSIFIADVGHLELIYSPTGKSTTRNDTKQPRSDAVFRFLSDKFAQHTFMVECFLRLWNAE